MISAAQVLVSINIKTKLNLRLKANTTLNEAEAAHKKT